jgi:uncharacterized membrane-anchored protein
MVGTTIVRTFWIVRWRRTEERLASLADALVRRDQLDAQGIEAELFEVTTANVDYYLAPGYCRYGAADIPP